MFTVFASSISSFVLLRINTGLPLHLTVILCPSSIRLTSTSVVPKARVSSAGLILLRKGHIKAAVPTAPIEIVLSCKKSLLLLSGLSAIN